MLEYDKIDISEGIDINKTSASKECDMNFIDVIVSIKENDYRIHFWYTSKNDAINLMNNSTFNKKLDFYNFFLLYIKDEWNNLL